MSRANESANPPHFAGAGTSEHSDRAPSSVPAGSASWDASGPTVLPLGLFPPRSRPHPAAAPRPVAAPRPAAGPRRAPAPHPAALTPPTAAEASAEAAGHAATVTAGLSRVTVAGQRGRADLAVPVAMTLAELLPTLLSVVGAPGSTQEADSGWVLQRLGQAPFDSSQTVAALGIRDGETLHVAPAQAPLPEAVFDDVLDAVATVSRERSDPWSRADSRRMALIVVVGAAVLGAALLVLPGSGLPSTMAAVFAGGAALIFLGAATAASRAWGDGGAATALAVGALPYAALAGPLAQPVAAARHGGAVTLALGAAGVALAAVLGGLGVGERARPLGGVALAATITLVAALVDAYTAVSAAGSAAATLGLVVAAMPLIPGLALRLARIPLPAIPTGAADLRAGSPPPAAVLRSLSARGDGYLTELVAAVAAVAVGCAIPLVADGGWGIALAGVASAVLLLRARLFLGRAQRLWCLGSGLLCAAAAAIALTVRNPGSAEAVLLGVAVLGSVALTVAVRRPDRRPSPVPGRLADITEIVLTVSMLPLGGAVLDLYGALRHLAG